MTKKLRSLGVTLENNVYSSFPVCQRQSSTSVTSVFNLALLSPEDIVISKVGSIS